jgi:anti-sigma B factor antagonist
MDLQISRWDEEHSAVIALHGELELNGAPLLRQALIEAIGEYRRRRVIVDLEGVDFIDSAGLGVLVGGLKRARTHGGDLVLVASGRSVLNVLELTGLTRVFELYSSREAALRGGG